MSEILNPRPLNLEPQTGDPNLETTNPKPYTLNPKP